MGRLPAEFAAPAPSGVRFGDRRSARVELPVASMPPVRATQATSEELVRGPERRSNLVEAALGQMISPLKSLLDSFPVLRSFSLRSLSSSLPSWSRLM